MPIFDHPEKGVFQNIVRKGENGPDFSSLPTTIFSLSETSVKFFKSTLSSTYTCSFNLHQSEFCHLDDFKIIFSVVKYVLGE